MKKFKNIIIWIVILGIAFFLRFYKLGEIPSGFYVDEASIGYNAYSILHTGKDEFGKSFPVVFRSFNDFKTPIYIYFSIPFIKLFGLSSFSVRFLSAFSGFLSVPLIYLLIRQLAPKKGRYVVATIASIIFAISPWSVLFSRASFEVNLSVFLFLLSTYFFYLSQKRPYFLILSASTFALTITSYHSQRIVIPIFLTLTFIKNYKLLLSKKVKKYFVISLILGFILLLPTVLKIYTPGFLARASINIFNANNVKLPGYINIQDKVISFIINSRLFLSTKQFLSLYFAYFSPRSLFILGDPDIKVSIPTLSVFYLWTAPFYFLGLFLLIKKYLKTDLGLFTLTLLLLAPIPAAITSDPFSTIRSFLLIIPLTIVISIGIYETVLYIKSRFRYSYALLLLTSLFVATYSLLKLYSGSLLLDYYKAKDWNFGFRELSNTIKTLDSKVPIIVDNARVEPYSELLFFLKFDPKAYQSQNIEVESGEYYSNLNRNKQKFIGNIETRNINWETDTNIEQYLIGDSLAISDDQIKNNNLTLVKKINYPDQSIAFVIVKTRHTKVDASR